MTLPSLLNPFENERDMARWAFHNKDSHLAIVGALQSQKSLTLNTYVIDPMSEVDMQNWLRRHQNYHNDMVDALGISGSDLSSVDWKDKNQRDAWIRLHFVEHYQAHILLGIKS
jgi:hypothetical protein